MGSTPRTFDVGALRWPRGLGRQRIADTADAEELISVVEALGPGDIARLASVWRSADLGGIMWSYGPIRAVWFSAKLFQATHSARHAWRA